MLEAILSQHYEELAPRAISGKPIGSDEMPTAFTVQTLREARGLSQIDLASVSGMLPDHLRAIEAGLQMTIVERQTLAAALGVPVDTIA